ncbi:hypothetical protein ACO0K0_03340 [Undibacterium sp. SXout11W]|uniref:hypothetical protein n=1 Tax=Undibacterium sp. SXout11W TaxID=3413050 RepID=UPI003BF184A4
MSLSEKISLPELVSQVNQLPYEYADGDGIEFEPYDTFLSADETADWFKAWTGNPNADASKFRVFGQDCTGGYAAFWIVRNNADLLAQPIVFMGSEGEAAILARNFYDYLWLLAAGVGPCEVASFPDTPRVAQPALESFALKNSAPFRTAARVLQDARAEFPSFVQDIEAQCR